MILVEMTVLQKQLINLQVFNQSFLLKYFKNGYLRQITVFVFGGYIFKDTLRGLDLFFF